LASTITVPSFVFAVFRSAPPTVAPGAGALEPAALDAGTPAGALDAGGLEAGGAAALEAGAAAALVAGAPDTVELPADVEPPAAGVELLEQPLSTNPPTVIRAALIPRNLLLFNGFLLFVSTDVHPWTR
jgi:hypothetical protein